MVFGKKKAVGQVSRKAAKGEKAVKEGGRVSGGQAAAAARSINERGERVNQHERD